MGKIGGGNGSESEFPGQTGEPTTSSSPSRFFCQRCISEVAQYFSLKCFLVVIISLCVFLSALFLLIPSRSVDSGFDASQTIKTSASIQAYFRLQKTVLQLVPHLQQLENEIYKEIGTPDTNVVITSLRRSSASNSNSTYVVFGVLPDRKGGSINPLSLSVLKSSLIELFLQEANLNLTNSTFGVPSSFGILKFRGGITVIPRQPAPISQIMQTLFNFTINNSIYDVKQDLNLLTKQLKTGLRLRFDENVFVQVTNKVGSTVNRPVVVQAAILSETGSLQPQRLKQLARTIKNSSPSKNLGLNNTMFGRVKSVRLSSYLQHTLQAFPPSSSPASSPKPTMHPCSASSPHPSSPRLNINHLSPCSNCDAPSPSPTGNVHHNLVSSPFPPLSKAPKSSPHPPYGSPNVSAPAHSPPLGHSTVLDLSPSAAAQPPSGPCDGLSSDFQPFASLHNVSMQGQEKSSNDILMRDIISSSGAATQTCISLGIHVLTWVAVVLHLLC